MGICGNKDLSFTPGSSGARVQHHPSNGSMRASKTLDLWQTDHWPVHLNNRIRYRATTRPISGAFLNMAPAHIVARFADDRLATGHTEESVGPRFIQGLGA